MDIKETITVELEISRAPRTNDRQVDEALVRALCRTSAWGYDGDKYCAAVIEEARVLRPECEHEWVDARNEMVISGELCLKCLAIRAGNQ